MFSHPQIIFSPKQKKEKLSFYSIFYSVSARCCVRNLKSTGDVRFLSLSAHRARQESSVSLGTWGSQFCGGGGALRQLVWDCCRGSQTEEERRRNRMRRGVRKQNEEEEDGFPIRSVSSANLYTCMSVLVAIETFLVGPSWFSCEIVLVIFKLLGCLSN